MEAANRSSSLASTIRWAARILFILAIAFISLFAFDVFSGPAGLGQKILNFLLHMIPSFVLIIILVIAWKHELAGGILTALAGLATAVFMLSRNYQGPAGLRPASHTLQIIATVAFPFVVVGLLFIISSFLHRPKRLTGQNP